MWLILILKFIELDKIDTYYIIYLERITLAPVGVGDNSDRDSDWIETEIKRDEKQKTRKQNSTKLILWYMSYITRYRDHKLYIFGVVSCSCKWKCKTGQSCTFNKQHW